MLQDHDHWLKFLLFLTGPGSIPGYELMSTSAATICCTTEQKWQNCAFLSGIFRGTYVFIWCSYSFP
jgi:hypothetical protein